MPNALPTLVRDDFESQVFGSTVLRLACSEDHELASIRRQALRAVELVTSGEAVLVSCRIRDGDEAIDLLRRIGFRQIERLIRFERPIPAKETMPKRIRLATPEDQAACVAIAGTGFKWDRFHMDTHLSNRSADALKAAWVRNCFAGRSDLLLVGQEERSVCGFLNCLLGDSGEAVIDLIAVSRQHRSRGWGSDLIRACLSRLDGTARVLVAGTQADNVESVRMYEKLGFHIAQTSVTLHLTREPTR